jgi:hypothetical protein
MVINGYDFDGVVSIGITPSKPEDVIITGRCVDEAASVNKILRDRGIFNAVYFNPTYLERRGNHSLKSRETSGKHKAHTIHILASNDIFVSRFFEDDPVQAEIINKSVDHLDIVLVTSTLVTK